MAWKVNRSANTEGVAFQRWDVTCELRAKGRIQKIMAS